MSRDLIKAHDAIDRVRDINSGLDALACLIVGCNESDVPSGRGIAELISAMHQEIERELKKAEMSLKQ